jgi:hypothetical protein
MAVRVICSYPCPVDREAQVGTLFILYWLMNIQVKQSFYSDAPTPISKDAYALLNFFRLNIKHFLAKKRYCALTFKYRVQAQTLHHIDR